VIAAIKKTSYLNLIGLFLICFVGYPQTGIARGEGVPVNKASVNWPRLNDAAGLTSQKKSFSQSFTDGVKSGFDKFTNMLKPKPAKLIENSHGESSVFSDKKPGPAVYTAVADMHFQAGRYVEAETNYQKAIVHEPSYLKALVGYAKLKEKQTKLDSAVELYEKATIAHPSNSSVLNNLGLCLARKRDYQKSLSVLTQAIRLQPKRALYRNNIATVMVEIGRVEEALAQLKEVHEESVAYYNVGYLLQRKRQSELAARYFLTALEKNPLLEEARVSLKRLGWPNSGGPMVASEAGRTSRPEPPTRSVAGDRMVRKIPLRSRNSQSDRIVSPPSTMTATETPEVFDAAQKPPAFAGHGNIVRHQIDKEATQRPKDDVRQLRPQRRNFFTSGTHRRRPVTFPLTKEDYTKPIHLPSTKQRQDQEEQQPKVAPLPPIGQSAVLRR